MADDFLSDALASGGVETTDPNAGAVLSGRAQGMQDFAAQGRRPNLTASPEYHRLVTVRQNLLNTERMYHQRLADFDRTEGRGLLPSRDPTTGKRMMPGLTPDEIDRTQRNAETLKWTDDRTNQALQAVQDKNLAPLRQKRQWLMDEAAAVTRARQAYDSGTYIPARNQIARAMVGDFFADQQQPPSSPKAPASPTDYLAPEGLDWQAQRIRDIQQRRRLTGEAPIAPGSMGDPNAKWSPVGPIGTSFTPGPTPPPAPEDDPSLGSATPPDTRERPQEPATEPAIQPKVSPFKSLVNAAETGVGSLLKGAGMLSALGVGGEGPIDPVSMFKTAKAIASSPSERLQAIKKDPLYHVGQAWTDAAEEFFPLSPAERASKINKFAQMVGGFVPLAVSGGAAPVTMGLQALGDTLDSSYADAIKAGKTPDEAAQSAVLKAGGNAAAQSLIFQFLPEPLKKIASKQIVDRFANSFLTRWLANRVANAAEGSVLGATSKAAENVTTGKPATQDVVPAGLSLGALQAVFPRAAGARPPEEPPGQLALPGGEPTPALPTGERPALPGAQEALPAAEPIKALPLGEETRWEFGTPEGRAQAKANFQKLQAFHAARAEELQQAMQSNQLSEPERAAITGTDPLKDRLAQLDARVGPEGAKAERKRINGAISARTNLIQSLRQQNVPDATISQLTGLHPDIVSSVPAEAEAVEAPRDSRVAPDQPIDSDIHKQAGFDTREELLSEHEKNAMHDAGETPDEYAQRVYCSGLGGRNAFSIR